MLQCYKQYSNTHKYHSCYRRSLEGCGRSASTGIAVNYVNLPAHIGMRETVIVDNIRPCGIGSDFQGGWLSCNKIFLHH